MDRYCSKKCLGSTTGKGNDGLNVGKTIRPKENPRTRIISWLLLKGPPLKMTCTPRTIFWHRRMGHAKIPVIEQMVKDHSYGMNAVLHSENCNCKASVQTNGSKQPAPENVVERSEKMTIDAGFCGSFKQESFGGKASFVTFVVTWQRYTNVKLIKGRYEVLAHFQNHFSWPERSTSQKLKSGHSNNAGELLGMMRNLDEKSI